MSTEAIEYMSKLHMYSMVPTLIKSFESVVRKIMKKLLYEGNAFEKTQTNCRVKSKPKLDNAF